MTFDLTGELANAIATALENQEERFLIDAKRASLVNAAHAQADEEIYYALPEWDSAAGFKLREEFVKNLHSPLAQKALQNALHSGRGVFKNFKNALRVHPEVEKTWHRFKNKKMYEYIGEWYNSLREIWGLEKLDYLYEENDDLVHNDFTFQEYVSAKDKDSILQRATECNDTMPEEVHIAASKLWKHFFEYGDSLCQTGFICHALTGDFVGCITASSLTEKTAVLTSFFVTETYRGLGIGSELFSMCLSDLKRRGVQYVLIANTIFPDSLTPLLACNGFEKTSAGFAAKLY
ncbi:MAG: GNAT family N-acetyltransferase [Treponema sp.]|nr:GNAT family N-acetyltransferase [Treponema sp.]